MFDGDIEQAAYVDNESGRIVNSTTPDGSFSIDGLDPQTARDRITAWLTERYYSSAKAREELGYRETPLETTVGDTVAFYRAAGAL